MAFFQEIRQLLTDSEDRSRNRRYKDQYDRGNGEGIDWAERDRQAAKRQAEADYAAGLAVDAAAEVPAQHAASENPNHAVPVQQVVPSGPINPNNPTRQ